MVTNRLFVPSLETNEDKTRHTRYITAGCLLTHLAVLDLGTVPALDGPERVFGLPGAVLPALLGGAGDAVARVDAAVFPFRVGEGDVEKPPRVVVYLILGHLSFPFSRAPP